MKNLLLLAYFFLTLSAAFGQTKYMIYFKDKGVSPQFALQKTGALYKEALSLLTPRAIARREKVMPAGHIVTYEDLPIKPDYISSLEKLGVKIENKLRWFNAVSAYLTPQQITQIEQLSFVSGISPVGIIKLKQPAFTEIPTNSLRKDALSSDYGLSLTQYQLSDIPAVQAKGINGKGIIIGILDDGFIWKNQESLAARKVLAEYNFVFHTTSTAPQPGDALDSGHHGTYVFSILAGYKNGFIIGPAYNASFLLAKTEDDRSESHIEEDNYAAALQWMEAQGVDITTSSLGYNIFDDTTYSYSYKDLNGNTTIITKAVNLAFERGVLTFTAAGNEGNTSWYYVDAPADAYNVIAVGAVDANNIVASFSSHGPTYDGRIKPDLTTMGVDVYGANANFTNQYEYANGTSAATPIASGIGAELLSVYPSITNVQARNILLQASANHSNPNNNIGYGLLSAKDALSYPVLLDTNGAYQINKIFFVNGGVDPSTVKIFYSDGNSPYASAGMSYDDSLRYAFTLPNMAEGSKISFYFTYRDSSGNSLREPASDYYTFNYGQYVVTTGISQPVASPVDVLGTNYPNPFNATTTIRFYASASGYAKLVILDGIGKTVKVLFDGNVAEGNYNLVWDGKSSNGIKCASGVYYYILTIGGKSYGNKMVLLR